MIRRDEHLTPALRTASAIRPSPVSTVSTALMAAGNLPVWPTMSGLAIVQDDQIIATGPDRLYGPVGQLRADISGWRS